MSKPYARRHDDSSVDPAERSGVFTVHVRTTAERPLGGRVTHAATGEVAHFDSLDELAAFLRRAMTGRS